MDEYLKQARSCLYTVKLGEITEMIVSRTHPKSESGENGFQGGFATAQELRPGMLVDGRYSILSLVGKGGMGAVYRAHYGTLNKEIALKTISGTELTASAMRRFQDEARAIARLDQENVVKVFDFGLAQNGQPYYTMELLSGESLAELIARSDRLDAVQAVEIFIEVCRGLAAAHAKGLVHGDIKPANIFLHSDSALKSKSAVKTGTAKIVDFGVVSIVKAGVDEAQFETGGIFGSPLYMSPEQFRGEKLSFASDIYSCGCALYETLTGVPPFMGANVFATMNMHLKATPAPLSEKLGERGNGLPKRLEELVSRMLAKEGCNRPQSFAEVEQELQTVYKVLCRRSEQLPSISLGEQENSNFVKLSIPQPEREKVGLTQPGERKQWPKSLAVIIGLLSTVSVIVALWFGVFQLSGVQSSSRDVRPVTIRSSTDLRRSEPEAAPAKGEPDSEPSEDPPAAGQKIYTSDVPAGSFDLTSRKERLAGLRTFRFPVDISLGGFTYMKDGIEIQTPIPARGAVTVPFASKLKLDRVVGFNPQLLNGFKADSLYFLFVDKDVPFDDRHMEYVSRMPSVVTLSLHGAKFSTDFIAKLNRLSGIINFDYDRCSPTASILLKYKNLQNLNQLNVSHCDGVSQLLHKFPLPTRLSVLDVSHDCLGDKDIVSISRIKSIESLKLTGNSDITTGGILRLCSMPALKTLEIEKMSFDPSVVDSLKACKTLKNLRLEYLEWNSKQVDHYEKEWPRK